jgi:hypothetical protein
MTSISIPSIPSIPSVSAPSRRVRRSLAAALVVAAVFVPATSAAAFVAPRAVHAMEIFAGDLTGQQQVRGGAAPRAAG